MTKTKLECGCEFEFNDKGEPIIDYNLDSVNLQCPLIWDLISSGRTTGLFQIDSGLGQMMSKKLQPRNIEHLAALISIMRPSCLQGKMEDGKSIADHYIDRKNGVEPIKVEYEPLKEILKDNYQMMIYQEDALKIAQEIAGFNLQKADDLRRAIGKKKADLMAKLEKEFVEGCSKLGKVTDEQAKQIFGQIKASQRYSFNRSHAVSYALMTYLTAIPKVHASKRFYKSWLNHSCDKIKPLDEVKHLVADARTFNVDICNPDIRLKNENFKIIDGRIFFGLQHIKGVGEAAIKSLLGLIDALDLNNTSWSQLLFGTLLKVNKTIVKNTIATGCFDYLKMSREQMLFEHDTALKLTKKEVEWIRNNLDLSKYAGILDILNEILSKEPGKGQALSNKNRKNIVKGLQSAVVKPPFNVKNSSIARICALETSYLGTTLSCHKVDEVQHDLADTTIKEYNDGKEGIMKFIVQINKIKENISKKNGLAMAFLAVEDATDSTEGVVAFNNVWENNKAVLFEGNTILMVCKKSDKGSLIILSCKSI